MSDEQKIPTGRLGRLARMARAGARTGVTMLRSRDASDSAERTAAVLGQLRGVATKLGQMASYVDGVIPPEHRDAYERSMTRLQSATPRSSTAEIRQVVEAELGDSIEALFAQWDDTPIASASIGQVHRARLHDGRAVAVKVQHPGIAEALEADLGNVPMMEVAAGLAGMGKFDPGRVIREAAERFREELDYSLEARRQSIFASIHRDDPQIVIPAIIEERSTSRVMTSELLEAMSFEEARQQPHELRSTWAGVLWRFVYKATLYGGMFNADPHPGNYLFFPDGRVGFLDFGCVQPIPEYRRVAALQMHIAAVEDDRQAFCEGARTMLHLDGGLYEQMALDYADQCFRPLRESPFRIDRPYAASLVERMKSMTRELRATRQGDGYVPMPDGFLFINRLQFGFYSVLARMDAEVDYASVEAQYLPLASAGRHQPPPAKG